MKPRKSQFDGESLRREYNEKCPKYERLAKNLKPALEGFLNDANIPFLNVDCRIKEFDSFLDKIEKKGHKNPFEEVEDICGLRIICYYTSDLERISDIINREFDVKESIDKTGLLEPDRFGYRSLHFVVNVKEEWLNAPNYRGLADAKAEIQVRTVLMHAWADIEHKLAYKKAEHVPDEFRRKLSRLSALFEVADEQFDGLRMEREEYAKRLVSEEVRKTGEFDINQEMNLDSLQAFLDFYFPSRPKNLYDIADFLDEITDLKLTFKELKEGIETTKDILPSFEAEALKMSEGETGWDQDGTLRAILDLANDDYWAYRKELARAQKGVIKFVDRWRKRLHGEARK